MDGPSSTCCGPVCSARHEKRPDCCTNFAPEPRLDADRGSQRRAESHYPQRKPQGARTCADSPSPEMRTDPSLAATCHAEILELTAARGANCHSQRQFFN